MRRWLMILKNIVERPDSLIAALLEVWEASVRATHDFLSEADIRALLPDVKAGVENIGTLICALDEKGRVQGFMGVDGDIIEMLFISPGCRGKGLGSRFIRHALSALGARRVDVNEQNPQAAGFYKHMGFRVYKRSELDGQGRPFPILHMQMPRGAFVPEGYAVQLAEAAHIPFLNDIELAAASVFPPGSLPEHILADRVPESLLTEGMAQGRLWVALDQDGNPVGYGLVVIHEGAALLAQLDVHPAHGRKGLGSAIVRRAIDQARDNGIEALYLTSFSHVPWNAPFYEKFGFVRLQESEQPGFIREALDAEREHGLENRVAMRLGLSPNPFCKPCQ